MLRAFILRRTFVCNLVSLISSQRGLFKPIATRRLYDYPNTVIRETAPKSRNAGKDNRAMATEFLTRVYVFGLQDRRQVIHVP